MGDEMKYLVLVGLLLGGCSSSESLPTVKVSDSGEFYARAEHKVTPVSDYKFALYTSKATYYTYHDLDAPLLTSARVEIKSDGTKFLCAADDCARIRYLTVKKD